MKIIGFAGRKNSGKNTLCNFMTGYQLLANKVVDKFDITQSGQLYIEQDDTKGVLNLEAHKTSPEFYSWAAYNVWPNAKIYAFAEPLKELCIDLFDLPREVVYGTDEQKNTTFIEHIRWESMPGVICNQEFYEAGLKNNYGNGVKELFSKMTYHDPGSMTVRQILQFMGTEVMRKIWSPVWVNKMQKTILEEKSMLSLVCDVRFDDEAQGLLDLKSEGFDVKIVELTRTKTSSDKHSSENGISPGLADFVLDNQNMSLVESCNVLAAKISEWGWV